MFSNPQLSYACMAKSVSLFLIAWYKSITPLTKDGLKILMQPKSKRFIFAFLSEE